MPKRRPADRVGIIADLHCGSKWGLLDPDDAQHKQNVGQRYLWACWLQLAEDFAPLDLLAINADVIDGSEPKSQGTGILTADTSEQAEIAYRCLRAFVNICKPAVIVRTGGTSYHEGFNGALKLLDKSLGITVGRVAEDMNPLNVELEDGHVLNIKHHPEGSSALYTGTVQDRELLWATLVEATKGIPEADIIVRSHLHHYSRFDTARKAHILTPCFQLQSGHAQKQRYYRFRPDIGGVILARTKYGRYAIVERTFALPKIGAVKYAEL